MPGSTDQRFAALLDELERWNRKVNLTAVRDRDVMATLHIDDSLSAVAALIRNSDAGLPRPAGL